MSPMFLSFRPSSARLTVVRSTKPGFAPRAFSLSGNSGSQGFGLDSVTLPKTGRAGHESVRI